MVVIVSIYRRLQCDDECHAVSVSVYRRVFRSLVELEDICKSDHKAVDNILLKSIVLGDIPILQNLHGKCI